jgi:hypothetical protein
MLAYVFWHVAAPDAGRADYEGRLARFHAALRAAPPPGMGATATFGLHAVPWLEDRGGYEDWYLVDDFASLGTLNEAAVSGGRRAPHDAAAALAATGAAAVMGHVAGPLLTGPPAWAAWLAKPAGTAYADWHAALAEAAGEAGAVWQRQMVLGPAPEFCVLAPAARALPATPAHAWDLRPVVPPKQH